jgi:hypothetical protein
MTSLRTNTFVLQARSVLAALSFATLIQTALVHAPATAQPAPKPNIIFLLMDNLGYGELGVYGGGITRGAPTPRRKHGFESRMESQHHQSFTSYKLRRTRLIRKIYGIDAPV